MSPRRSLIAALVLSLLVLPCGPARAAGEDQPAKVDPAGDAQGKNSPEQAASESGDPLAVGQDGISRRYKRFEDTLYKIYESMRRTDPDRAELLMRAIGKSKEDRIAQQMSELVQLLKDNRQLGEAVERQGDVVERLQALLDLLLSEDRAKELKEEQARIKRYLADLNKIIAREKGNRADNERGAPADEVAGAQKKIADQAEDLGKNIDKDDAAKAKAGSESGQGDKGKPNDGKPGDGKPGDQKPSDGKSPEDGKPEDGESEDGKPQDGKPEGGKPGDGKPSEGQPSEGQPSQGKPPEGQPGQCPPGDSQEGAPPQSTPGREELEKATRNMREAIERLKKNQRHEASDEQDEAIANLQKAKDKLEEILRQLREEERERFLAMLEARFQRMLSMQLLVYDGTLKLARTPETDRSGRHSARSQQLARQEEEIALEATRAITLLRDEGTAVAFPEAVEQMRDDMQFVVARLERTDVGELTQSIEREIIEALEEMIEALQKEMEKSKEEKENPPAQEGQPQDPPLVDQLAELKMLRTLQLRVNRRTKSLGRLIEGEQAQDSEVLGQLQNLGERQARIQRATYDIATGRNQ